MIDRRLVVAPMMGRTDAAGCAYLHSTLPGALLFTEMIAANAIVYGGERAAMRLREYFELPRNYQPRNYQPRNYQPRDYQPRDYQRELANNGVAHNSELANNSSLANNISLANKSNIALQLGGCDAEQLYRAVVAASSQPFCEFNLNLGCPSARVGSGGFGAFLMKDSARAASCVAAMRSASGSAVNKVSVKTRIGVDELDSYDNFISFIERLHDAGCNIFYIHARKAWLHGVSPRDNRRLPPLRADFVERLQTDMPQIRVIYNGGISDGDAASEAISRFGGVMVGRALWRAPQAFKAVLHKTVAPDAASELPSRREIAELILTMAQKNLHAHAHDHDHEHDYNRSDGDRGYKRNRALGNSLRLLQRAMSLYHGEPHAREWRKFLAVRISCLRDNCSFSDNFSGNFSDNSASNLAA